MSVASQERRYTPIDFEKSDITPASGGGFVPRPYLTLLTLSCHRCPLGHRRL